MLYLTSHPRYKLRPTEQPVGMPSLHYLPSLTPSNALQNQVEGLRLSDGQVGVEVNDALCAPEEWQETSNEPLCIEVVRQIQPPLVFHLAEGSCKIIICRFAKPVLSRGWRRPTTSTPSRRSRSDYLSAQYAAEASIVHSRSGSAR